MASEAVTAYLNDHLAGSTAALQLLDHLVDTAERPDDKRFFVTFRAAVTEDRDTLQHVMRRVGGRESSLRHVGGWIAEKAVRLKLMYDDPASRTLAPLEGLELLALGILGKRALWRALAAVGPDIPSLQEFDFVQLEERANDQHGRVEARRLESARQVLGAAFALTDEHDDDLEHVVQEGEEMEIESFPDVEEEPEKKQPLDDAEEPDH